MGNSNKGKGNAPKPDENKDLLAEALELTPEQVATEVVPEAETVVDAPVEADPQPEPEAQVDEAPVEVAPSSGYRRMEPTYADNRIHKKAVTKPTTKKAKRLMVREVGSNPATLFFPTDKWGVTKDLKKAFIALASRVAGDASKKALVDETLKVLVTHLNVKFESDKDYKEKLLAKHIAKQEAE